MTLAGYTSVAEFHYVHHDPAGRRYADPAEIARRIVAAAREAGIALALLPVYAHSGFGGRAPAAAQRRFVHTTKSFDALVETLAADARDGSFRLGVAPHSLRAVTPEALEQIIAFAPGDAPVHIHAAEQAREVEECVAALGKRPVEWLLDCAGIDERWCVVHATHMTSTETARLATSGAVAGLAPTTESDLGDGIFPGAEYLASGGRFGVGSDSNTAIDPFTELRTLEWSQRLRLTRRNVLSGAGETGTIGDRLWSHAAASGARALGLRSGAIAPGLRADLVVLDGEDATLATAGRDAPLDAAIFAPVRRPVRDVIVGGRFVVRDGRHAAQEQVEQRYCETLQRVWGMP
jgi:formimidoylglutamate deiminase